MKTRLEYFTFLGIPFLLLVILQSVGFDGLYGQDSYEYLRYTKAIGTFASHGVHPGSFYWPVLYPTIGSVSGLILGNTALGLQTLTCFSLSIVCIYMLRIIELTYPKASSNAFLYVVCFGLLSPFTLKSGLVVMSDMTASMFIVLTYYHFLRSENHRSSYALIFFFATCAVMTRYPCLIIVLPIVTTALLSIIRIRFLKGLLTGGILSLLAAFPFLILQAENLSGASSNYFLNSWSFFNFFRSTYQTSDGLQTHEFPNLVFVLNIFIHPGFIFIGTILLLLLLINFRNPIFRPSKTIAISILLYIIFLAGIPFQNTRVLGLLFPLILLLLYPAFEQFLAIKHVKNNLYKFTTFCIITQLVLWAYTFRHIYQRTIFEKQLAISMMPYQNNVLYGFDFDISLKGRGLEFDYRSLYDTIYGRFSLNELVLFSPKGLETQWEGKNPMLNWHNLENQYELEIVEEFNSGWHLYRIVAQY